MKGEEIVEAHDHTTANRVRSRSRQAGQTTTARNKTMKTKAAKQPKQSKPTVQLKDIKPKKDAKGGIALLLPAVQKCGFLKC